MLPLQADVVPSASWPGLSGSPIPARTTTIGPGKSGAAPVATRVGAPAACVDQRIEENISKYGKILRTWLLRRC
jgi:hypothetical protein